MKSLFIKGKTTIFFMMNPKHIKSLPIIASIITVSSSRTKENDTSGNAIRDILSTAGIRVEHYAIIPDNIESIRSEIYYSIKNSNCVIINGGTGLTHDDCTIEAVTPLLEKKIDGFGELFRQKSYHEIGTSSMLSRTLAGTLHGSVIFCIPGSTPAVTLATKELILPEIAHILSHANK
jgi:molybdenum cofactor biosynthesis protein B